jgi:ferritin-like metal-binding protein YciE
MSAPTSLKDTYADEMKDLWSANDQMTRAVKTMSDHATDPKLKKLLESSLSGITKHSATLKGLIGKVDDEVEPEHCKGMEGLCKEAIKHTVKEAPDDKNLLDIAIIAQYQRMSHYGLAGFGSAASYAEALGMKQDVTKLKGIVSEIYKADEYASMIGEKAAAAAPAED